MLHMRNGIDRKLGLAAGILLLACATDAARADSSATVHGATSWGQWEGWGTSLAWWANVYGDRSDLADVLFTSQNTVLNGQTLPGLQLNIARYNVGACSSTVANGQSMVSSPNIPAFRQIQGYWTDWNSTDPASASWNWNADANQRQMLQLAKARGVNNFELFSNSPMWWMCKNHNPSGADKGSSDNLESWNYQSHALYMATVAKYAADNWGINFASVEPFNEPSATWWKSTGTQEGCHFSASTQASVVGYLRSELDARGLQNTRIAASDENTYDQARSTWNSFSAGTKSAVGQVNVHGYQYGNGRRDQLYNAVGGKTLWNSEYADDDGSGMKLASNLNLDFHWLHATAWCYWQPFDSGGWGLVQSNPGDNWMGTANPKYFVLAQFSRHIHPGMTIIDSSDANSVAAYDPVSHKLVLVTTNYDTAQWLTFSLSDFADVKNGPVSYWRTVTDTGEYYNYYNDIAVNNGQVRIWCPANSVQTLEIANAFLTSVPEPGCLALLAGVLLLGTRVRTPRREQA